MGINYYTREEACPTCDNRPAGIHLGKSSAGWQFSFQYNGGQYYKNVTEMKEWLKDKRIEDEYGVPVTHDDFWKMVKSKQKPEYENHAAHMHEHYPHLKDRELIIDGYSFSDCDFS